MRCCKLERSKLGNLCAKLASFLLSRPVEGNILDCIPGKMRTIGLSRAPANIHNPMAELERRHQVTSDVPAASDDNDA